MNKTAIKSFAVRARNRLIDDMMQKAYELGITKDEIKDIETFAGGFKIKGLENSKTFNQHEQKQREKLIAIIEEKGFDQVIEEAAYTWFNRFIALRFMEVNDYLPSGVRVLSSVEPGKTEPDIIKEALHIDLNIDRELVYKLIDEHNTEALYKYLLVKQCNELGTIMPQVFEEIADYTELLLPNNLLGEGSVIRDLVASIAEEDYKDQVEIIGWLYQFYISEKKDEVFADLKKNKKITKENIPAATQLFTPKWIVKYMVENSLGRLWLQSHGDDELKAEWTYYLEEADQDPDVEKQLAKLKDPNLNPEHIKVLDPSMGSGHILVYAFDVLYDIYVKANYSERDIPQLILEKNLYGLDIDDRAGQLAAFALMMKARSKNRRIFRRKIELNVCSIQESNGIPEEAVAYFAGEDESLRKDVEYVIDVFRDGKDYGSILQVKPIDFYAIEQRLAQLADEDSDDLFAYQYKEVLREKFVPLLKQAALMSDKYDVVITNPPYMGSSGMNTNLAKFVKKHYPLSKSDLFAVFIEKCQQFTKANRYTAMITQQSWMFLSSFEKLREEMLANDLINMAHLGARAFEEIGGEIVQTTAFVTRKSNVQKYKSTFVKLVQYNSQAEKEKAFLRKNDEYTSTKENFLKIPGTPIAYWINEKIVNAFDQEKIGSLAFPAEGIKTGNNDKYLLFWPEVAIDKISKTDQFDVTKHKWNLMTKGGKYRKWYGNLEHVVYWENNGKSLADFKKSSIYKQQFMNMPAISWTYLSSGNVSFRYFGDGILYNNKGPAIFFENDDLMWYIMALLNSHVGNFFLNIFSNTLTFLPGDMKKVPVIVDESQKEKIDEIVKENITIAKANWDAFETSYDFKRHPFLTFSENRMHTAFEKWNEVTREQFAKMKANEEEINRIFIHIYGLEDELTPDVTDKDITLQLADRVTDVKSFISYAVGCMFGRYSLDEEGIVSAGGELDMNRYRTFIPALDNVLMIADDDYFADDIVNRFIEFMKITFGKDSLEENVQYVAEAVGMKGNETARQAIRRYFLKDFYNDHVKLYQKRPFYWLFDSGKQNGFKALIYMHRYDAALVAKVRTDYLHKLQRKYEAEVERIDNLLQSDLPAREKSAALRKKEALIKQIHECQQYDQVIAHVANQKKEINLDDGVKVNYDLFQNVIVPQGEGKKPMKASLLAKI